MNDKYFRVPGIKEKQPETDSDRHRKYAWNTARAASHILKDRFGAFRVVVFGSLSRESDFTQWSDIDLAAWGIPPEKFYRAVADVTGFSQEFEINLTDIGTCAPSFLEAVEKEGIDL
jgi:predicted nucleotidyltransferase